MTENKTRERILREAFRQFINRSYHKVSIANICSNLGISKGAVFHYFNSKYDLACDSLLLGFNHLWAPELKIILEEQMPLEKLKQFIRSSIHLYMRNPALYRLSYELFEEGNILDCGCERWLELYSDQLDLAVNLFKDCKVNDPEGEGRILIASIAGLSFLLLSDNSGIHLDEERVTRNMINLFVP